MSIELTVLHPFGAYAKGEAITDADKVKEILASEHAHHVIKVAAGTHAAAEAAKAEDHEG